MSMYGLRDSSTALKMPWHYKDLKLSQPFNGTGMCKGDIASVFQHVGPLFALFQGMTDILFVCVTGPSHR